MPRKKVTVEGVQNLYLTAGAAAIIASIVQADDQYKEKTAWELKYMLALSSLIERTIEAGEAFVPVCKRVQAKILGCRNQQCARIYSNLVDAGLIRIDRTNYKTGEHSYEYGVTSSDIIHIEIKRAFLTKPSDRMLTAASETREPMTIIECEYKKMIDKITLDESVYELLAEKVSRYNSESNILHNTTISHNTHTILSSTLSGTFVPDTDALGIQNVANFLGAYASVVEEGCEQQTVRLPAEIVPALKIIEGRMHVHRKDKESRIYTNITNLAREFRPYLRLSGKPLIGLDIGNSQPLLAVIIFRNYSIKKYGCIKEDVIRYQERCELRMFYEDFMGGIPHSERSAFKKKFFGCVFFNKEYPGGGKLQQLFMEKYPTCHEALVHCKGGYFSKDFRQFAVLMQKIEASIVVNANMDLVDQGIDAVNIFDSIYVTSDEHYDIAESLLRERFSEFGISPAFNKEDYRPNARK